MSKVVITIELSEDYFLRQLESCGCRVNKTLLKHMLKDARFIKNLAQDFRDVWEDANSAEEGENLIMMFEDCIKEEK